ncbi:MAG: type 1 glutamine amidotransferase [Hyphomonas sp.]|uniref:glutamine amidotransferase-related protein n=1 Tax=Hyphomonas sp. TaxID=87 RepID=UPI001830BA7A|nr:glutamine amidotransferase [Hyphomonas sp.]MBA3068822.1 type 1 glutamine amidotransferase [Hyphomonas sp.]MBU3919381.1 type 1 glutamine amidotransferase [Alphaproteobacteria bacterium]MBU4062967.1 type 1 glutamine amidotransferase [Alphaproteobacteria bacterium]MBU4165499.1 type 1 glutamine amidotransferase [Alphaproteobacteria bacterium]
MKLTVIETGLVPPALRDQFPDYPAMFRQMFTAADPALTFDTVSVVRGEALPAPASLDAVLYTGSPAGVYEDHPWIAPLMAFARAAAAARTPQVGICFGHQLMGEALGGKVVKSEKGWGVGRHTYDVLECPAWSGAPCPATLSIAASHQDQVVVKPPSARVLAASAFTPFAGLEYDGFPAVSFQCHPEFSPEYSAALYGARRGVSLTDAEADAAIASLDAGLDRERLAAWLAGFLRSTAPA